MMKKIDDENKNTEDYTPLLSQNISIVEVGAYSHIFDIFLNFLDIKTLIITDIDSVKTEEQKDADGQVKQNKDGTNKTKKSLFPVSESDDTSNASIRYFLKDISFDSLKTLDHKSKILSKKNSSWAKDDNGLICIAYQTKQSTYHARSFEDAFISVNLDFIKSNKDSFKSLKNRDQIDDTKPDYFDIAEKCIDKKTLFATDILYYSDENYQEWQVHDYIKEGLVWLSK